jgi:REP element-mobilizing transposase RayT
LLALDSNASPSLPAKRPWAYFITFSCYGTKLHGRSDGSVDRHNSGWKGRYLHPSRTFENYERALLRDKPVVLNPTEREIVLDAIRQVCSHENWTLHAAHVRSSHVHIVVTAGPPPEIVMTKFKAYASRALNAHHGEKEKRWSRHGSTIWLWDAAKADEAVHYVVVQQGRPMAMYQNPGRWDSYIEAASRVQEPAEAETEPNESEPRL